MRVKNVFAVAAVTASLLLGACGGSAASPAEASVTEAPTKPPATKAPTETATPIPPKPDPTRVEFQSADGTPLVGYFYPAAIPNAPVVVLMHWAGGDQTDWTKVGLVDWLQNWPQTAGHPKVAALVPSIYPPMPSGLSFAVFTFDYRGFGESGGQENAWAGPGWAEDSVAGMQQAAQMEGVDPQKVSAIGSSIGADGAVDACADLDCLGALSLSPGSYLERSYADAVSDLDARGIPAWCIYSENDSAASNSCKNASGEHYFVKVYPGEAHGTTFLMENYAPPDIGQVLLDWLLLVNGLG